MTLYGMLIQAFYFRKQNQIAKALMNWKHLLLLLSSSATNFQWKLFLKNTIN